MLPIESKRCRLGHLGVALLLFASAGCQKSQPCERREDCPSGSICVAAIGSCVEFEQADLSAAAEDLTEAPAEDLRAASADLADGGARPVWKTGLAAVGTLDGPVSGPAGVCYSGTRLYVSDSNNHRVLVYDTLADKAKPIGAIGRADLTASTTPVVPPTAKSLNHPAGLWCDGDTLLVADRDNHRVLVYGGLPTTGSAADAVVGQATLTAGDANRKGTTAGNSLAGPEDVFWDGERLYIADTGNNRVVGYGADTAAKLKGLATASAQVLYGQKQFTDKTATTTASESTIGRASGVAVQDGRLAVVDGLFHRVLIFDATAPFVAGTAAKGDAVLGQVNLTNKNPGVGDTKFTEPVTLRFGEEDFFVVDQKNNRVLVFEDLLPEAGSFALKANFALGQPRIGTPMSPAGSGPADLKGPGGAAVAVSGGKTYLVVADSGNNRVQLFRAQ